MLMTFVRQFKLSLLGSIENYLVKVSNSYTNMATNHQKLFESENKMCLYFYRILE